MSMKKERVRIEIDVETGNYDIDIVNVIGPTCQKDADKWAELGGGAKKVVKKQEFFKQGQKAQNLNLQEGT
jgi:hypothetical protein